MQFGRETLRTCVAIGWRMRLNGWHSGPYVADSHLLVTAFDGAKNICKT